MTTGTQYVLELFQGTGDGYYFGSSSQIGQHLTYFDMKYCNSCTQNTFPTSTLSNYHYGYPDLWYFTKQTVTPAPTYSIGNGLDVGLANIDGCEGQLLTLNSNVSGAVGTTTCSWSPSGGLSSASDCNPTMVLDSSTYYVLSVTDSLGCHVSDSLWITNGTPSVLAAVDSSVLCPGDTVLMTVAGADYYTWGPGTSLSSTSGDSVWAFPPTTTVYSVIGTDSTTGCRDTMDVQVNVSTVSVIVVLGPLNMCEGDSLVISVSGADTYSWSPGSSLNDSTSSTVIATPSSDVTYTIMGYDTTNGCTATNGVMVLVHPLPVVTFDLPDHFCDLDGPSQLSSGNPSGGTYSGTGVSSGMFAPGTAGAGSHVLTYTYADLLGCEASDTALAIVDICIGVAPSLNVDLSVYPNPSSGIFNVVMGTNPEATSFRIQNMMGQVVRGGEILEGKNLINMTGCSSGLYIMSIESAGMRRSFNIEVKY
ncbi:MAG: T9SS type A sorting domain-containing protein [Bacteroidia bacterium]